MPRQLLRFLRESSNATSVRSAGRRWCGLFALLIFVRPAQAQDYPRRAPDFDRVAQEILAEIQTDQPPNEDLYGTLLALYQSPLSLNTARPEELRTLPLLREAQVAALLAHRQATGPLLSLYELQAVPGWDLRTIARIAPFVTVEAARPNAVRGSLWQRIRAEENNALLLRYRRVLQPRKGFSPVDTFQGRPTLRYLGGPNAVALRYRVSHARDFSLGLTAENDAGEPWAWNPARNQFGPDFLSAHFVLYERGRLKTLALGDYQLQFGQGLLLSSGLVQGKGAETITTLRRPSLGVRPYAALLENTFFRGAAATYQLAPRWEATAFASRKNIDANARQLTDSLGQAADELSSSLLITGLHRTSTEIANRQRLTETVGGGHLGYASPDGNLSLGLTAVVSRFGNAFQKRSEPYNRYEFSGQINSVLGLHYSYGWRNLLLFGEGGRSASGGLGGVSGVLASLGPTVDAAVLVRHYDVDFHTLYGNAFGENTRNINESGLYVGLKIRPVPRWEISAYFDQFSFPWLRYRVSAPSQGQDALVRLAFAPAKTSLLYVQYRARLKPLDLPYSLTGRALPLPGQQLRHSALAFVDVQPTRALGLRTRLQVSYLRADDNQPWKQGFLLSQDAQVQVGRRLSLSGRYAVFDTDDFDTRQYAIEQDVLYAVSIPVLNGRGTRAYFISQLTLNKTLTLWLRYAETRYRDQATIGSGLEEIQGRVRSEVTAQLRVKL